MPFGSLFLDIFKFIATQTLMNLLLDAIYF